MMSLATTLADREITLQKNTVKQSNFSQFIRARICDTPAKVSVHIVPNNDPPTAMGKLALTPLEPALRRGDQPKRPAEATSRSNHEASLRAGARQVFPSEN